MSDPTGDTASDGTTTTDTETGTTTDTGDRSTIRSGRNFEDTFRLDATDAGDILIALGERLRDDDQVTIVGDDWELPFAFGQPVELTVEYEGVEDPELEIEIELPGRTDERSLDIR